MDQNKPKGVFGTAGGFPTDGYNKSPEPVTALQLRGQRDEEGGTRVAHQLTLKTCHRLGFIWWAQGNHQGPYKVEEETEERTGEMAA